MQKIDSILKEIFPSAEMASYLARCPFDKTVHWNRQHFVFDDAPPEDLPLSRNDLADAIAGAPISLERKRDLFLRLAEDENNGLFRKWADLVSQAIQEMQPKPGEVFYLIAHNYCEERSHLEDDTVGAFLSWEYIFEAIREYLGGDPMDEDDLIWFTVEKWTPDGNGRLKNNYSYEVIGDEVWFCDCEDFPFHEQFALNGCSAMNLNLQVPFHAGDILTVDCRPYAPVSHIVVLGIADNCDCCCFQALYREGDCTWGIGAVKHSHVFPPSVRYVDYSPLYRLPTFQGQLPEEERLLERVSRYVNGEEARGAALWKHIYDLSKGDQEVTEAQILSYIEGEREAII